MTNFDRQVFVNCPFDQDYYPILKAVVFTVLYCGLKPRFSSNTDSGKTRIRGICELIRTSKFSIHDLSRMELVSESSHPRFNMPFELGLDLGAKEFSEDGLKAKSCLILEKEKYRYQKVISDISGQDIRNHENDPLLAVKSVRDWLNHHTPHKLALYRVIWLSYSECISDLKQILDEQDIDFELFGEISLRDLVEFMEEWILNH